MEEISFRCPPYLAQRFWLVCNDRGETPGGLLRAFMIDEVRAQDDSFTMDLENVTGLEITAVQNGSAPNVVRRRQAD